MKKSILLSALLLAQSALAHRVWVETNHIHDNEILKAELGYGEFPKFEPIPEKRLHIFREPMKIVSEAGTENLVQKGEFNYQYESAQPLKEGTYLVLAEYQPTYWSKNKDGWQQQNMTEMKDAEYCELTRMFGKNINAVGHESAEVKTISKPVGHMLEIVPLDHPANALVGEPFPVKVLFKGEPLAKHVVTATFKGFDKADHSKTHKVEAQAFSDTTDENGVVNIIPLRQGFWKVNVELKVDYEDQKVCQKLANYATLTFNIGHSH